MDERLDMEKTRLRILGADRLDGGQAGPDQPALDLVAEVTPLGAGTLFGGRRVAIGEHEVGLGDRPGEKADLVDRRVDAGAFRKRPQRARDGARELGKALAEGIVEQGDHVGRAVVHQRPHHLQAVARGGVGKSHHAAEVEAIVARQTKPPGQARLGQPPSNTFADRADAERGEAGVVGVEVAVVAAESDHVEPLAAAVDVIGAFEPRHPERAVGRAGGAVQRGHGAIVPMRPGRSRPTQQTMCRSG